MFNGALSGVCLYGAMLYEVLNILLEWCFRKMVLLCHHDGSAPNLLTGRRAEGALFRHLRVRLRRTPVKHLKDAQEEQMVTRATGQCLREGLNTEEFM